MFGCKLIKGTTRNAILIKRYAIKIPVLYSWEQFIRGLVGNMEEWKWSGFSQLHSLDAHLAPTLWHIPGGFLNIMVRAESVTDVDRFWDELGMVIEEVTKSQIVSPEFIKYDAKPDNFGYLNGVLVKIDYAK